MAETKSAAIRQGFNSTLPKEAMQKEELVETKKEMSHLDDRLAKQSELLNAEMTEKQKIQNILEKNK